MKTIDEFIIENNVDDTSLEKEIKDAYKLGQINILLELTKSLVGYPVNGLVRGIITEEQLSDKLVEVSNA